MQPRPVVAAVQSVKRREATRRREDAAACCLRGPQRTALQGERDRPVSKETASLLHTTNDRASRVRPGAEHSRAHITRFFRLYVKRASMLYVQPRYVCSLPGIRVEIVQPLIRFAPRASGTSAHALQLSCPCTHGNELKPRLMNSPSPTWFNTRLLSPSYASSPRRMTVFGQSWISIPSYGV